MLKIDVVIVNWNAGQQLDDCLSSINTCDREGLDLRITIVDNGSVDGSIDDISMRDLILRKIKNPDNRGFSAACNQGALGSEADYLLFLNPDARVEFSTLQTAASFLQKWENLDVGICGVQLIDEAGTIWRSCARFPKPRHYFAHMLGLDRLGCDALLSWTMLDWDHENTREVDHVIGAFYLVRRKLFADLSGFDERFFVYLEDLDFSLRARRQGWRTIYLATARAFHKGGGTSDQVKAERLFYSLRSRFEYLMKHHPRSEASTIICATFLLELPARLIFALLIGSPSRIVETLSGFRMLFGESLRTAISRLITL